jgi:CHAT domain-containing protein/tetratricopeptide (TPR) repeat protein
MSRAAALVQTFIRCHREIALFCGRTMEGRLRAWSRAASGAIIIVSAFVRCAPAAEQSDDLSTLQQRVEKLGESLRQSQKLSDDLDAARHSLVQAEAEFGPNHLRIVPWLKKLSSLYLGQGRYDEAEPFIRRALAIEEHALGPNHQDVERDLNGLASVYRAERRYAEAEPLVKRALAIAEKARGPDHPDVASYLNDLAVLALDQNRYTDAESFSKRALAIDEKVPDPDERGIERDLSGLASVYRAERRYAEAEPLVKRALAIAETAHGPDQPDVASFLSDLASLYLHQNQYDDAQALFDRVLAIDEKAHGRKDPDPDGAASGLAELYILKHDVGRSRDFWERSMGFTARKNLFAKNDSERDEDNRKRWGYIKFASRVFSEYPTAAPNLPGILFEIAQWTQFPLVDESVHKMVWRSYWTNVNPRLAPLLRERQDLVEKGLSTYDAQHRVYEIDTQLKKSLPNFSDIEPIAGIQSVESIQARLRSDEVLLLFLDTPELKSWPEETFIWVVTKTDLRWVRSVLGTAALTREVAALRCGLDYAGSWIGSLCQDLLKVVYTPQDYKLGKPLPFDLARAHELYRALFGQIEDLIKDKHLLIVASGPLMQLPFQVLVTEPPKFATPTSFADYRDVAWLSRKYAISLMPTVSSLEALRGLDNESHASEPYIGFGNPLLEGEPMKYPDDIIRAKLAREAHCATASQQKIASVLDPELLTRMGVRSNGGLADLADIRSWAPLPEAADELCDVAQSVGVNPTTHVYLGERATEAQVKRLSDSGTLAKYRIVHFATHGSLAGELSGMSEPGLLLTPPDKASENDDGYLAASEIAKLKLNADWVILSACNTAAGRAKGAEALSGLAASFFYAGARSLLVSHWEVASEPTVKLITKAVDELKRDPNIGRAEALRRSMVSMIANGKNYEAHPAFWAPFVLVGEGGADR